MNNDYANEHSYFIPMIDAADIFKRNSANLGVSLYKPYKKANGSSPMRADKNIFSSSFRFCLETNEIESAYTALRKGNFAQEINDEINLSSCTDALVCVTFEFGYKEYNKHEWDRDKKGALYVKAGYGYKDGDIVDADGNAYKIEDCACVHNGKLLAIITSSNSESKNDERESTKVNNNILTGVPCPYFEYDETGMQYNRRAIKKSGSSVTYAKIDSVMASDKMRDYLYQNGFYCLNKKGEPIHYVRYKRSAGMSRENKCVFIREDIEKRMLKWSTLTDKYPSTNKLLKKYKVKINDDVVSAEAYGALSLSTLENMLHLDINNILFMRDIECEFAMPAMNVTQDSDGNIITCDDAYDIRTKLTDGEALLDESVFEECGRKDKGMMLLRNRYFKSCAFNTKLQQWFSDNNITEVCQLNGVTLATDISQIKMIVTESSLKFCKMIDSKNYDFEAKIRFWAEWLGEDGCDFGIVKSEKPTAYLDGKLVRTNYQMLNTLNVPYDKIDLLLEPMRKIKDAIRNDSNFFRYWLTDFNSRNDFDEVYSCCAILEVLSNTEIDKAKRIYAVDTEKELKKLKKIYEDKYLAWFPVPEFFTYITTGKTGRKAEDIGKQDHRLVTCPMQLIYTAIGKDERVREHENGLLLSEVIECTDTSKADKKTVNDILKKVNRISEKRNNLNSQFRTSRYKIHNMAIQNSIARETSSFFASLNRDKLTPEIISALINETDGKCNNIAESDWLLLAALCNSGKNGEMKFGKSDSTEIYKMMKNTEPEKKYMPTEIKKNFFDLFVKP